MKTVLSFTIVFALLAGLPAFGAASTEASSFEAQMNETREEFFGSCSEEVLNLEKIEIDNSRIIHLPQEYTEPEPPSLFAPFSAVQASAASAGPFDIGDRRDFRARTGAHGSVNEWRVVSADLAGQGEHTNIWVVDCSFMHGTICVIATCHQKDITPALANEIANQVDVIYRRMTGEGGFGAHAGVRIEAGFSNMPAIGDLSGDGKVNYLLYDIMGSGGSGGSFTAGFFTNEDFFTHGPDGSFRNTIDMLHIDIGNNQGFNAFRAGASDEDRFSVYNTLAHELQHLLFYMHFGIYAPSGTSRDYAWLNEALSELAGTYYVQKDAEIVSFSRLRRAAQNSYSNTSGYGDFLNFNNSLKNYGMCLLFGMLMYKTYGNDFVSGIYDSFTAAYPPAQNFAQRQANQNTISGAGHDATVGRALRGGTGVGTAVDFSDTLPLLYYLFMENFAADGGMIYGTTPAQSMKFYKGTNPVDNLWAIRPVAGFSNGRIFEETIGESAFYPANNFEQIPLLPSGGSISLRGYGLQSGGRSATHEMLYELGRNSSSPFINITAPNDGSSASRYYLVIPKDTLQVTSTYAASTGRQGADVYPLTKGVPARINTRGQYTYLLVVTFNQNISSSITFSWSAATANDLTGAVTLSPAVPRFGQTITASMNTAGTYNFRWMADGVAVGTNSDTYTITINDIGKVIRVEVTEIGKNGTLTAQTSSVVRAAGPPQPEAPTVFAVSNSGVILNAAEGFEYSNNGLFWQDSPEFIGLLPNTDYNFYQRVKATVTTDASARSGALSFSTTDSPGIIFFVGSSEQFALALAHADNNSTITLTDNIIHTSAVTIVNKTVALELGNFNLETGAVFIDGGVLTTGGTGTFTGDVTGARGGTFNGTTWFTADYNRNGGTGEIPDEAHLISGSTIMVASASSLTRAGFVLGDWNTAADGSGTTYKAGDTLTVTENITLFAQWNCFHLTQSAADCTRCGDCGVALDGKTHDFGISNENGTHRCKNCAVTETCSPNTPGSNCTTCNYRTPGGSNSGGGGGGGGSGGSSSGAHTPIPPVNIIQSGTGTMISGFNIPRVMITAAAGSLPVIQLRVSITGSQTISAGSGNAGQNAVLVRLNTATRELEVVSAAVIAANGNAALNIAQTGDYIVLVRKTGDITGTGEVGTSDALALLRHIAGISELNSIELFAANGKIGDVGTTDALNILRYVAGVIAL